MDANIILEVSEVLLPDNHACVSIYLKKQQHNYSEKTSVHSHLPVHHLN